MDISERRKTLFYRNLLLLGWNSDLVKRKYRLLSDKNMFDLPNPSMLDVVSFFLLTKLNGTKGKKYRTMQPPISKGKRRHYLKTLYVDLCNMKNESHIGFPHFTESLLTFCHGDKMYELLVAFSSYVLYMSLEGKDIGLLAPTILNEENYDEITKTLKTSIISSASEMQTLAQISDMQVKVSLNFAKALTIQFKQLKVILANKETGLLEASNSGIIDAKQPDNDAQTSMKNCMLRLEKIQMYWKVLEKFLNSENEMWNGIYPVTEEKKEKFILRGRNINAPSTKEKNLNDENEEVSLKRSLSCINAFLERYLEIYRSSDLSNIHIEDIEEDNLVLEIYNKLKPLRESLLFVLLPNLRESTEKLKEKMLLLEKKSTKSEEAEWMLPSKSLLQRLETSVENDTPVFGCEDDLFTQDVSDGPSTSTFQSCSTDKELEVEECGNTGYAVAALSPIETEFALKPLCEGYEEAAQWMFENITLVESLESLEQSANLLLGSKYDPFTQDVSDGPSTSTFQSPSTDQDFKVEKFGNIGYAGAEALNVEKKLGIKPLSKAFTEFQVRAMSDSEEDSIFRPDIMIDSLLSFEDDPFTKDVSEGPSTSTLQSSTNKDLKVDECGNIGYAVGDASQVEKKLGIKPWSKAFTEFQDRAMSDSEDSMFRPDVMIDSDLNESDL